MSKELDEVLIDTANLFRGGISAIISNLGKSIAVITVIVACIVTFTDVSLIGVHTERYATTLAVILISSYVMYFSLFDAGEEKGKESSEYKRAFSRYSATRVKFTGEMMPSLRDFCAEYSRKELEYRKKERLIYYGLTDEEIARCDTRLARRAKRRTERLRAHTLTPRMLLSISKSGGGELQNPERGKIGKSLLKLLPSTVCTCLTVSIVLTARDGMSAADIFDGILKLCTLPIVGIRGYVGGIDFAQNTSSSWLDTKMRILESFMKKGEI